jgi:hypothetical protein
MCNLQFSYNVPVSESVESFGKCIKDNNIPISILIDSKHVVLSDEPNTLKRTKLTSSVDPMSDYIFFKGWHAVEHNDDVVFRWGKAVSYLNLSGLKGSKVDFVLITTNPYANETPIDVFVLDYTTKDKLGVISFYGGNISKDVSLDIDSDDMVLMFVSRNIWIPAVFDDNSDDWRELGVGIANLEIK